MIHLCPPPPFCIAAGAPHFQRVLLVSNAAIACHHAATRALETEQWGMAWSWMERAANYIRIGRTIALHDWGGGGPPVVEEGAAQRRRQSAEETSR